MSRFLLHILVAFAELEREMIRERAVSGLRTARANGKAETLTAVEGGRKLPWAHWVG